MNKEILIDIGSHLSHLRTYPLLDICHYFLTALLVRDDIQQHQTGRKSLVFVSFRIELNFFQVLQILLVVIHCPVGYRRCFSVLPVRSYRIFYLEKVQ